MRCSFVHFGDVHLGTQQYDSPERLNDFGRAWLFACDYIARERPDFAICAGDLFNRFTINPVTFDQALVGLQRIREAGVPIVDIQGNHDRARYGEARSWLHTLADQGLLTYLDVPTSVEGVSLRSVPAGGHLGSLVEWSGCRILGLRYLGASTERVLEQLEPALTALPRDRLFTILTLHAGLEGIVPNFIAELSTTALERLRGLVDYVALGHIHKHYAVGTLAYNGGSLETWAINEWGWPRGLLHVEVDTDQTPAVSYRLIDVPRRPFVLLRVNVSDYGEPRSLLQACWDRLQEARQKNYAERPVVFVTLAGELRFDLADLPTNKLEDACRELLDPLFCAVRPQLDTRDFAYEGGGDEDQTVDRVVLERDVIQARLASDERYAGRAVELAKLAVDLKDRALRDVDGAGLLDAFRRATASPLPDSNQPAGSTGAVGLVEAGEVAQ